MFQVNPSGDAIPAKLFCIETGVSIVVQYIASSKLVKVIECAMQLNIFLARAWRSAGRPRRSVSPFCLMASRLPVSYSQFKNPMQ